MKISTTIEFKLTAIFAGAALILRFAARLVPGAADFYAKWANPLMTNTLGRLADLLPLSLVEILICGILLGILCWLMRLIKEVLTRFGHVRKRLRRSLLRILLLASVIFLLYEAGEDVYFYCEPFSSRYGFGRGEYSTKELETVCRVLAEKCNLLASLVERDEDGVMITSKDAGPRVVRSMEALGSDYPALKGFYTRPKGVMLSELMSRVNMAGIYSAYTCEANYNRDMTPYNIPFTMGHELSHVRGILQEDEANFAAFLGCFLAEDPDIAYSGALSGWVYCGNELYKRDYDAWLLLYRSLDKGVISDLDANTQFWEKYRSKVSEAAQSLNDSYLKGHGQKDGAASYDRVVDLIVSWYSSLS